MPMKRAKEELFFPTVQTNIDNNPLMTKFASVSISAAIDYMEDKKNATYRNLSISRSIMLFDYCEPKTSWLSCYK